MLRRRTADSTPAEDDDRTHPGAGGANRLIRGIVRRHWGALGGAAASTVLMTLEDYGLCRKGEAGAFVADGAIEIGGRLPINTSGGLLSETGMPGLQLVMEGVRQMRGTARLQVPGAKLCLVSNQGGTMHTHGTLLLGN